MQWNSDFKACDVAEDPQNCRSNANTAFEQAINECEASLDILWNKSSEPVGYTLSWSSQFNQRNNPDDPKNIVESQEKSEDKSSLSI